MYFHPSLVAMRSKDYNDMATTFRPLQPVQMVRVALVNGINPAVEPDSKEREKYLKLLKEFTYVKEYTLNELFGYMQGEGGTQPGDNITKDVLKANLEYDSEKWKELDYKRLQEEGVIIAFDLDDTIVDVRTLITKKTIKIY